MCALATRRDLDDKRARIGTCRTGTSCASGDGSSCSCFRSASARSAAAHTLAKAPAGPLSASLLLALPCRRPRGGMRPARRWSISSAPARCLPSPTSRWPASPRRSVRVRTRHCGVAARAGRCSCCSRSAMSLSTAATHFSTPPLGHRLLRPSRRGAHVPRERPRVLRLREPRRRCPTSLAPRARGDPRQPPRSEARAPPTRPAGPQGGPGVRLPRTLECHPYPTRRDDISTTARSGRLLPARSSPIEGLLPAPGTRAPACERRPRATARGDRPPRGTGLSSPTAALLSAASWPGRVLRTTQRPHPLPRRRTRVLRVPQLRTALHPEHPANDVARSRRSPHLAR